MGTSEELKYKNKSDNEERIRNWLYKFANNLIFFSNLQYQRRLNSNPNRLYE